MTATRIEIWREDGGWMAATDDPEAVALFGTNTLPTPFRASTPAIDVLAVLAHLNPGVTVVNAEVPGERHLVPVTKRHEIGSLGNPYYR